MASTYENNLNKLLFTYPTTHLTDFRLEESSQDPPCKTVYIPKPKAARKQFLPLKGVHTLSDWKGEAIPFDLIIKPKEILRKNPYEPQKAYFKPIDDGHDLAVQTRPRLNIPPALSLDDMTNQVARALIIDDVYTSDTAKGLREAVQKSDYVTAPLPDLPTAGNPLELPKLREPVVSPEWRMDSVSWDNRQLRGFCDATGKFWMDEALPKCQACDESQTIKAHRKMKLQTSQRR